MFRVSTLLLWVTILSPSNIPYSDLAQHVLLQANITAIRRVRKSDNNRIARAVGATIVNRVEDLRDADVGTQCGLFHIEKLGDELRMRISSNIFTR